MRAYREGKIIFEQTVSGIAQRRGNSISGVQKSWRKMSCNWENQSNSTR